MMLLSLKDPTLSSELRVLPVELRLKIQKNIDQLNFAELIHVRLSTLPYFWCRYSKHYTSILRSFDNEDFRAEQFRHLYRMTYQYRLKDDARWVWRMFAWLHGVTINPVVEEQSEVAKKYRMQMRRRIRPTLILGDISNLVRNSAFVEN
jgi:hypothetical protein